MLPYTVRITLMADTRVQRSCERIVLCDWVYPTSWRRLVVIAKLHRRETPKRPQLSTWVGILGQLPTKVFATGHRREDPRSIGLTPTSTIATFIEAAGVSLSSQHSVVRCALQGRRYYNSQPKVRTSTTVALSNLRSHQGLTAHKGAL